MGRSGVVERIQQWDKVNRWCLDVWMFYFSMKRPFL